MKIFYKTQEKIKGKMAFDKGVIHMKKETRTVVYDDELLIIIKLGSHRSHT